MRGGRCTRVPGPEPVRLSGARAEPPDGSHNFPPAEVSYRAVWGTEEPAEGGRSPEGGERHGHGGKAHASWSSAVGTGK